MEGRKEKEAREVKSCPAGDQEVYQKLIAGLSKHYHKISGGSRRETQNILRNVSLMHEIPCLEPSRSQFPSLSVIKAPHTLKRMWPRTQSTSSTLQWYLRQLHSEMTFPHTTNPHNLMPDPVKAVLWFSQPARRTLNCTTTICSSGWSPTLSSCLELEANKDKREIAVDKKKK